VSGIEAERIPPLRTVLKEGWHYIAVFALLICLLLTLPNESLAPFYATAFLLVWTQLFQRRLWKAGKWLEFLESVAKLFAEITGALLGVGIIIGAVAMTGLAASITSQLSYLAGDSLLLLLILAAVASFVLGFGLPSTPAYIFVAIIVAPALTRDGIEPLAAHMFLYYWGMISFITPPVAIAAYAAASLAGASPMAVGLQAVRLSTIIYFVPFFFVLNPVLILNGAPSAILLALATACIGVWLIVGSTQGYLLGLGSTAIGVRRPLSVVARVLLLPAGLCLVAPNVSALGMTFDSLELAGMAAVLALPAILIIVSARGRQHHASLASVQTVPVRTEPPRY
jgi:TRAP-type uncharacterized transport system fused permease subunit